MDKDKPAEAGTDQAELVKQMVTEIREGNEASIAATAKATAEAVAKSLADARPQADDKDDYDAQVAAWNERKKTALAAIDEAAAEGNVSAGVAKLLEVMENPPQPRAAAGDVSKDPVARTLANSVMREARREHKEIFEHYNDEVRDEIDALPFQQRLDEEAVRSAVLRVKTRHIDDIAVRKAEEIAAERANAMPPANTPRPEWGESNDTELHGLDPAQRAVAAKLGVSYSAYAEQLTHEQARDARIAAKPDSFDTSVEILPPVGANGVEKGKF